MQRPDAHDYERRIVELGADFRYEPGIEGHLASRDCVRTLGSRRPKCYARGARFDRAHDRSAIVFTERVVESNASEPDHVDVVLAELRPCILTRDHERTIRDPKERIARVVSVGRNAAWIAFEDDDRILLAQLRKRIEKVSLVPGDLVAATPLDDDRVVIDRRLPRDFALERTTAGGRVKTMAANVDGIAIVAAFARPPIHLAMIDELIAFAELHDLDIALVLTKSDVLGDDERAAEIVQTYRTLGYDVFVANPKERSGTGEIARALATRRTLIVGQSGVGKSSLFEALGGESLVGDVSKIGRGKQTTTTGRLYRFPAGFMIDSPGVGEFELVGYSPKELAAGFREIAAAAATCRFGDCTHRSEPGCSVRAALEGGEIAASRYDSYRTVLARDTQLR
jgi:ribosome biogenesis GTPase